MCEFLGDNIHNNKMLVIYNLMEISKINNVRIKNNDDKKTVEFSCKLILNTIEFEGSLSNLKLKLSFDVENYMEIVNINHNKSLNINDTLNDLANFPLIFLKYFSSKNLIGLANEIYIKKRGALSGKKFGF